MELGVLKILVSGKQPDVTAFVLQNCSRPEFKNLVRFTQLLSTLKGIIPIDSLIRGAFPLPDKSLAVCLLEYKHF